MRLAVNTVRLSEPVCAQRVLQTEEAHLGWAGIMGLSSLPRASGRGTKEWNLHPNPVLVLCELRAHARATQCVGPARRKVLLFVLMCCPPPPTPCAVFSRRPVLRFQLHHLIPT